MTEPNDFFNRRLLFVTFDPRVLMHTKNDLIRVDLVSPGNDFLGVLSDLDLNIDALTIHNTCRCNDGFDFLATRMRHSLAEVCRNVLAYEMEK